MVKLNTRKPVRRTRKSAQACALAGDDVGLRISLRHITPAIWRIFVVPGRIRLDRLHQVIQVVMGWSDSHLHCFRADDYEYTQPDPDDPGWAESLSDTVVRDERKHTLGDLVKAMNDRFEYTYDFGDDWEHEVRVVSVTPSTKNAVQVFCVHGERACPPEDCGSVPGYEELCAALPNPKHPEHQHWKSWIGDYDPNRFDTDAVNRLLRRIRV